MEAFWRHGFESNSISDLTHAMDINPPSLYAAFGDKEKLFLEKPSVSRRVGAKPWRERSTTTAERSWSACCWS